MRCLKKIIVAILSVLLIFVFNSCGDSDKNEKEREEIESIFDHIAMESELNSESESQTESESQSETETETQTEIGEHLYVVIPHSASAVLAAKAQELVDSLREKTELLSTLKYDNEHSASPVGTFEILVGNTDRLESKNAMSLLRQNDYVCRWDTGHLVICGGSDEATIKALERFIDEVLPYSNKYSLMEKDGGFESFEKIETESEDESNTETVKKVSTINGYSMDEFSIVYSAENKCSEKKMAQMLCAVISDRTGYLLDVVSSDELNSRSGKTIMLSVDENSDSGIVSKDGSVVLSGCNGYTLSLAVEKFIEGIDGSIVSGVATWSCDSRINVQKSSFVFDLMTYIIKNNGSTDSFFELLDTLALAKQDVYVIADVDDKLYQRLSVNIPANYTAYRFQNIVVVYKTSSLNEVTAKADEYAVYFDFEFCVGETLKYTYFFDFNKDGVNSEFCESMRKGVCVVAGNTDGSEIISLTPIAQGKTVVDSKDFGYKMLIGDFVCESEQSLSIKNTSQKLSCSAKLFVNISDSLIKLNDSLK